jgi:hypothetical protein
MEHVEQVARQEELDNAESAKKTDTLIL